MKTLLLAICLGMAGTTCSAQTALFPRHVEPASYPAIARTAHVSGKVVLLVTIGSDGRVSNVELSSGPPLLAHNAIENVKRWVFDRPAAAPFVETLDYDFEIVAAPCQNMKCERGAEVTYDFPEHVKVVECGVEPVDTSSGRHN